MYKVGVILPSRGLIFSRTAEDVLNNLKGIPHKIYFSHKRPIPECFNEPLEKALADKDITDIWFVEDDMIIPPDTLKTMLQADHAVVTADYPINKEGRGSIFEVKKQVIYCGTGCMLVKREVFNELPKPVFRTNIRWNIKNFGQYLKMASHHVEDDGYGLHDINFCMSLYRLNIPIHKIDTVLGQRKLIALGKANTNNGAHQIEEWKKVKKNQLLNQIKKWPVETSGNLTTVITPTGEVMLTRSHANKLIKQGLANIPPKRPVVVDWSGYEAAGGASNV